jgi:hypothetical protein
MYYKSTKRKVLIKYLLSAGFYQSGGTNHDRYQIDMTKKTVYVMVPRHITITPGVVDDIVKTLVRDCSFNLDDIKRHIK